MSRTSTYTQAVADVICERIANGELLVGICSEPEMPSASTVFKWLKDNPSFSELYARAREAQADLLADEALTIADQGNADYHIVQGQNGPVVKVDGDHIQRARLKVEQRRWMASKLKPKAWGEKQFIEHSGSIGIVVSKLTDDELLEQINSLIATGHLPLPKAEPVEVLAGPPDDDSDLL